MLSRSIDREVDSLVRTLGELREQLGLLSIRAGSGTESVIGDGRRRARRIGALAGGVTTRLRGHADAVGDGMSQHPIASAAAGFLLGLLIGRFFSR